MNLNSRRSAFCAVSVSVVVATGLLLPTLAGCKPETPAASNDRPAGVNQSAPAPKAAGEPVRREAPPERPGLNFQLFDVIVDNDEDRAVELVEQGASPNSINERGVSALHFAARAAMPRLTRLLLEYGAEVDAEYDGVQPIHWVSRGAAWASREEPPDPKAMEVVDILLEYGADINAETHQGVRPITFANEFGSPRWADFLISRGSLPE